MNLNALKQFSQIGFAVIPPEAFLEAADFCHQHVEVTRDVRFLFLEDCFRLSDQFWTEGDSGAVLSEDAVLLLALWKRHLPSILEVEDQETGITYASVLRDDLRAALAALRNL